MLLSYLCLYIIYVLINYWNNTSIFKLAVFYLPFIY